MKISKIDQILLLTVGLTRQAKIPLKTHLKMPWTRFCDRIDHIASKYRPDFLGTWKIAVPVRTLTNPTNFHFS